MHDGIEEQTRRIIFAFPNGIRTRGFLFVPVFFSIKMNKFCWDNHTSTFANDSESAYFHQYEISLGHHLFMEGNIDIYGAGNGRFPLITTAPTANINKIPDLT